MLMPVLPIFFDRKNRHFDNEIKTYIYINGIHG